MTEPTTEQIPAGAVQPGVDPAGAKPAEPQGADTQTGTDTQTGNDSVPAGAESTSGTDSVSGGDTQPGADTIAPLSADSYADLTLPAGLTVDDALFAETKSIFAEAGVNPTEAPKLLALYEKALASQATAYESARTEAFTQMSETWRAETLALPEFTGTRQQASLAAISKVVDEFGPKGVRDVLDATGMGNNPLIAQMFLKIADTLGEGRSTRPGNPRGSAKSMSYAEKMYGDKPA